MATPDPCCQFPSSALQTERCPTRTEVWRWSDPVVWPLQVGLVLLAQLVKLAQLPWGRSKQCYILHLTSVWYNIWVILHQSLKRGNDAGKTLKFMDQYFPFIWKDKNIQISFWARERVTSWNVRKEVRLKLQILGQVSGQDTFWMSFWGGQAHPIEKVWIRPWMCWRNYVSHLVCGHLAIPPPLQEAGGNGWGYWSEIGTPVNPTADVELQAT